MKAKAVVAAFAFVIAGVSAAVAHDDRYDVKWKARHSHTGLHITWRFSPGFPDGGPKKTRVIEAFSKWNDLDQHMDFEQLGDSGSSYVFSCGDHGYHGIFYNNADGPGGDLAVTLVCAHDDDTIHNFSMKFDEDETWYALAQNGRDCPHFG